jgi:hypothetical protein
VADHQAAFTGLKKNLAEARSERLCDGPSADPSGRGGDPYGDAVDSLTRLAQHLNGLRSGTSLQYELAKAHRDGKVAIRRQSTHGHVFPSMLETEFAKGKAPSEGAHGNDSTENVMLHAAAAVFGDLVGELDSPLRALSVSLEGGCFIFPYSSIILHKFLALTSSPPRSSACLFLWISRLVQGQLGTCVVHSPIRAPPPRTPRLSWTSLSNLPTGSNERFLSLIARQIMPCCVCINAPTSTAPPRTDLPLLPPPPRKTQTRSFLAAKASTCSWCTCAWTCRHYDRTLSDLLPPLPMSQFHLCHAGVCAGAHLVDRRDEQDLCG